MDFKAFFENENEKPFDNAFSGGGFCAVFRKIACIGDSLAAGTLEGTNAKGEKRNYIRLDYSWGRYIARETGTDVYNFSAGGLTAKEYCEYFADDNDLWAEDKKCQAYILALGFNDLFNKGCSLGDVSDINIKDYNENGKTFAGFYAKIIQRYKELQPKAKFFLMTMPRERDSEEREEMKKKHASLLYEMAEIFDNIYILDFNKYAPVYDEEFKKRFYLGQHMNVMGYILTAKMVMSYIDYTVRHNMEDFMLTGL